MRPYEFLNFSNLLEGESDHLRAFLKNSKYYFYFLKNAYRKRCKPKFEQDSCYNAMHDAQFVHFWSRRSKTAFLQNTSSSMNERCQSKNEDNLRQSSINSNYYQPVTNTVLVVPTWWFQNRRRDDDLHLLRDLLGQLLSLPSSSELREKKGVVTPFTDRCCFPLVDAVGHNSNHNNSYNGAWLCLLSDRASTWW